MGSETLYKVWFLADINLYLYNKQEAVLPVGDNCCLFKIWHTVSLISHSKVSGHLSY